MPIDSNIALGVRPIEQPNMLAQYGQVMQLRQMQQENESNNALRDFYARGGDINNAENRRQLMSQAPLAGQKIYEKQGEIESRNFKTGADSLKLLKENVGMVNTPEEMAAYLQNSANTPGGRLLFGVIPLDKAISAIPSDPKAFSEYKRNFGLTAEKLYVDANTIANNETSRANNAATVGASYYSSNVSKDNNIRTDDRLRKQQEFERDKRNIIAGEGQFLQTDAYGNVYPVSQYGATRGPNAPVAPLPSAASNNLITTQQPVANVNALTAPPVNQAGPTVAAAAELQQQQNVPRPKVPIRQPVGVMKDGKAVLVKPEEALGMQPASADAEKAARLQALKVQDLSRTIKNLEDVTKPNGLISQSTGSGIGRAYDVGAGMFGQATEGAIAAAKLAPIADMVLKMVPRFEGPQSDKDTQSYKEAAGQLSNSSLPTEIRRQAGIEVLRLMKEYKGQFVTDDMAKEGFGATSGSSTSALTGEDKAAMDWANSNPKDPRAAKIKQRLGG